MPAEWKTKNAVPNSIFWAWAVDLLNVYISFWREPSTVICGLPTADASEGSGDLNCSGT